MAIAILTSVTVSMAEATTGIFREIARVMRERMSTSEGSTSDRPGRNSTSSNVSASGGIPFDFTAIANSVGSPEARNQAAAREMIVQASDSHRLTPQPANAELASLHAESPHCPTDCRCRLVHGKHGF